MIDKNIVKDLAMGLALQWSDRFDELLQEELRKDPERGDAKAQLRVQSEIISAIRQEEDQLHGELGTYHDRVGLAIVCEALDLSEYWELDHTGTGILSSTVRILAALQNVESEQRSAMAKKAARFL